MTAIVNPMDLSRRNILVTGASSGIGRGTAILLSQLGASVILVARREDKLKETQMMMHGDDHMIVPFDLTDVDEIPKWMRSLTSPEKRLHGLVHSAGLMHIRSIREVDNDSLNDMMTINFNAAYSLTRGFRHRKVRADSSSIVFLASVSGLIGQTGNTAYSASKGALISVARALAMELAREQIRVNCVAPALVESDIVDHMAETLTPEQFQKIQDKHVLGLGKVEDVANAIAFLLADTGRWITGTTLVLDGGYTVG